MMQSNVAAVRKEVHWEQKNANELKNLSEIRD